jgi:hypothetical protein
MHIISTVRSKKQAMVNASEKVARLGYSTESSDGAEASTDAG